MDLTEGIEPGKDPALLPVAARVLAALRSARKTMMRIVQGEGAVRRSMLAKSIGRCLTSRTRKAPREKTSIFLQGLHRCNAQSRGAFPHTRWPRLESADPMLLVVLRLALAHRASAGPVVPIKCLAPTPAQVQSAELKQDQACSGVCEAGGNMSAHRNGSVCWSSVPIVSQMKFWALPSMSAVG